MAVTQAPATEQLQERSDFRAYHLVRGGFPDVTTYKDSPTRPGYADALAVGGSTFVARHWIKWRPDYMKGRNQNHCFARGHPSSVVPCPCRL